MLKGDKMKKFLVIGLVIMVFMFGCKSADNSTDLPPEPGEFSGPIGQAIGYYGGYSSPFDVFDNDNQIFFLEQYLYNLEIDQDSIGVDPSVNHPGPRSYVYKYGYYYTESGWEQFEYPQETVAGSNWIESEAGTSFELPTNQLFLGENYVVSYSCKWHDGWKCGCSSENNCGYWMLQTYVLREFDLPPEPEEPGSPILVRINIGPGSDIVEKDVPINVNAWIETSFDISQEMLDDLDLTIIRPDGSSEVITIDLEYGPICREGEGTFGCMLSFEGGYTPTMSGEYEVKFTDEDEETFRIYDGSFKSVERSLIDQYIITSDIGDYEWSHYGNYFGHYWNDVDHYYANYQGENTYSYAAVNVGDDVVNNDFYRWLDYTPEAQPTPLLVDGVTHIVYSYEWEHEHEWGSHGGMRMKWVSEGSVVEASVDAWDDADYDLSVPEEYLRMHPAENMTEGQCESDDDCPDSADVEFCNEDGDACVSRIEYDCMNPGTPTSYCRDVGGSMGCEVCEVVCEMGQCTSGAGYGEGYKIEKSGDELNLYQHLSSVIGNLDGNELESLEDGTFRAVTTVTTRQTLGVPYANVIWATHDAIYDDPALYLFFDDNSGIVDYEISFSPSAQSDLNDDILEDFVDERLTILNKDYEIVQAQKSGDNVVLTLMAGSLQDTLEGGETKSYTIDGKSYEVTVMIVSGEPGSASTKLIVNDEVTPTLQDGDTYELVDGTYLGIADVLPTAEGDPIHGLVEFYLGAELVKLDGSDNTVDINQNSNLNGITVEIDISYLGDDANLGAINMDLNASMEYFVGVGSRTSESAALEDEEDHQLFLETFGLDWSFLGLGQNSYETVEIQETSATSIGMEFINGNGVHYNSPLFYYDDGELHLGEEAPKELFVMEGELVCDEEMFWVESDEVTRVLQLKDVTYDSDEHSIKLKDLGTGDISIYDMQSEDVIDINLDGYTYQASYDNESEEYSDCITLVEITDDSDNKADFWTDYGMKVEVFEGFGSEYNLLFTEGEQDDDGSSDQFAFNFQWDSSASVLNFEGSVVAPVFFELVMRTLDTDSQISQGYTKYGTFLQRDTSGAQDRWDITIPKGELSANVWIGIGEVCIATDETGESYLTTC